MSHSTDRDIDSYAARECDSLMERNILYTVTHEEDNFHTISIVDKMYIVYDSPQGQSEY